MKLKGPIIVALLLIVGVGVYQSAYIVNETEQVVVTQFGRIIGSAVTTPGLKFKVPFIQQANYFPKNLLSWDGDPGQIPTLDMMVDLQQTLNHRLSLDAIASATFGLEKTAEGLQAIRWFKEGKLLEIAEYCCFDVKLTRLVHEHGARQKELHYHNRFGGKMTVPVEWSLD